MTLDNATMNSRLVVILVIIVGLISAVGVIISAVALGRPSVPAITISQNANSAPKPLAADWPNQSPAPTQSTPAPTTTPAPAVVKRDLQHNHFNNVYYQPQQHTTQTVWTVAVGYDNGPYDYRDNEGYIQGFNRDIVEAVCSVLHIQCNVIYDAYQNCWTTSENHYPSGGQGLFGQWYDGCIGWIPNRNRMNVFDFGTAYAMAPKSQLFAKKGDDVLHKNNKIAFIRGFAEDVKCLQKQKGGAKHPDESVVYADTPQEAVQMVKDGRVTAIFSSQDAMEPYIQSSDITAVEGTKHSSCDTNDNGGYSVMARKNNNFLGLWNKGLQTIKDNGLYKKLCEDAQKTHSKRGSVKCIEN